jgi:hypothetical protein
MNFLSCWKKEFFGTIKSLELCKAVFTFPPGESSCLYPEEKGIIGPFGLNYTLLKI